jgi:hypothetical protein
MLFLGHKQGQSPVWSKHMLSPYITAPLRLYNHRRITALPKNL